MPKNLKKSGLGKFDISSKSIDSESYKAFLEKYTKDKMAANYDDGFKYIRVYPDSLKTSSQNYDSIPWLYEGAQIVALNSQHIDDNLMKYVFLFNNNYGFKEFVYNH